MTIGQPRSVIHHLRRAALLQDGGGMTDGLLLEVFLSRRDEAAFEALVQRYGPMVLGVCRRLLRHTHDAEDAFQATFLLLARKAASIKQRESVGSWLHRTAFRAALEAKAARGRSRERQVSTMPEPEAVVEVDVWREVRPLLDQELDRLPDKYREAVVLCDLEGKTRKEAARQLGVPEGTLSGRLTTARRLLAERLARHRLMVSGGALAAVLSEEAASACVPKALVVSAVQAAAAVASGPAAVAAVVSVRVVAIMEGVLKGMLISKLKTVTTVLLVLLAGVGGGTVALLPEAAGQQAAAADTPDAGQAGKKAEDTFPGEWVWAEGQVGGLIRLLITKTDDGWTIQAWAEVKDGEKDQGKTGLTLLRDYEAKGDTHEEKTMNKYGFAVWDHGFAKSHVTLRVENDRLLLEEYRVFTDKSGRPNYRCRYQFKKKD